MLLYFAGLAARYMPKSLNSFCDNLFVRKRKEPYSDSCRQTTTSLVEEVEDRAAVLGIFFYY